MPVVTACRLKIPSTDGAGLEAGLHQRLIGGGPESDGRGGAQEPRRRWPNRPGRIPTLKPNIFPLVHQDGKLRF
ncbi:putative C-Mannosyltransferase Dpy19L2 [Manis pentadactyla]|nr:putative C-Mannosyltransferase Dpy19L2 [Manis pentadactyla]